MFEAFQQLSDEMAGMPPVEVHECIGKPLTCFEMRRLVRSGEFDIIHFAGHAQFVKDDPEAERMAAERRAAAGSGSPQHTGLDRCPALAGVCQCLPGGYGRGMLRRQLPGRRVRLGHGIHPSVRGGVHWAALAPGRPCGCRAGRILLLLAAGGPIELGHRPVPRAK